jgi:putative hemolysin
VPFDPRRQLALVRPALSEPSHSRRFLRRCLPDSWRFAHQMAVDLVRQLEFLAWAGRADAFDTYFLRQAEAMLRPEGLTELLGGTPGASEGEPITPDLEERLARFCAWSRAIVTAVLLDLDERGEVVDPYQALTYLLTRHVPFAKAAAAWSARAGMAAIQQALCELPGYALVLLATSPNDTVERFMARDAFWSAVMKRS